MSSPTSVGNHFDGNFSFKRVIQVRAVYAEMSVTGMFTPEQLYHIRHGLVWMANEYRDVLTDVWVERGVYGMSAGHVARMTGYAPQQIQRECMNGKIKCCRYPDNDGGYYYYIPYKEILRLRRRRVRWERTHKNV